MAERSPSSPVLSRRFAPLFALGAVFSLARCECAEDLRGLPVPQIELVDAAGNSHLKAEPWLAIAIGDADSGQTVSSTLTIKNVGTGPMTIARHCFVIAETADAARAGGCASSNVPFSFDGFAGQIIKADGSIDVGVRFVPSVGGPASVFLQISSDAKDEPIAVVQLTGRGTDGRLCVEPSAVYDFGDVDVGVTVQGQLRLTNCGVQPISIASMAFDRNPDQAFGVLIDGSPPAAPIGPLGEGESIVLDVSFTPQQPVPYRDSNAGQITAQTGPEFPNLYTLQLVGNGVAPPACQVNINPDLVNFGAVASNTTGTRQLIIQSVGQCACVLSGISDPLPAAAGFDVVDASLPAFPATLRGTVGCDGDPADAASAPTNVIVDISYTSPDRPTPVVDNASVDVTTDDPETPVQNVPLQANGGGAPFCQLAVQPEGSSSPFGGLNRYGVIEFGRTSVFTEKALPITLANVGNIDCTISDVRYDDPDNTVANEFRVETAAGADATGAAGNITILPNDTATYFAIFAPTHTITATGLFPSFGQYSATIEEVLCGFVTPNERCNGVTFVTNDTLTVFDDQGYGWGPGEVSIGFSATPVEPDVDVIPGQLDFGLVTLDCGSPEQRVTVYNTGTADLIVGEPRIEPVVNPLQFVVEGTSNIAGTWPLTIAPGSSLAVQVRYYATALGIQSGQLVVPTFQGADEGPPVTVPLRGEGTLDTEHTDIFDQFNDPKVDVLWVVDDSGSMGPFQDLLASNFNQFFVVSNVQGADYHIAVTTTLWADDGSVTIPTCSVDADCGAGGQCFAGLCTAGSTANSLPDHDMAGYYTACDPGNGHYISPASADPQGDFGCNVRVSDPANVNPDRPGSDAAEGGLRAALKFLSPPLIDDPAINGGFLRDDAKLHIIFVEDEPEQSKGGIDLYIDFFKNVKGFRNEDLVAVSAFAAPPEGCTYIAPDGSSVALQDDRYKAVVDEMNGRFESICNPDWTTAMSNLGLDSLGLRIEFQLSRAAQPGAIDVCVRATPAGACVAQTETSDGAATGWFYDAVANSVVFNPGSVPPRGSRVEVSYSTFCF